ncbi:MAG: cell wall-active antibiotics response protein LiaF [Lactovum sp.]
MNKRLKIFLIIESVILLFFVIALLREGFILYLLVACGLTYIARRFRAYIWTVLSIIAWIFTIINLLGTKFFWLAILFPILAIFFYMKSVKKQEEKEMIFEEPSYASSLGDKKLDNDIKNELIDLSNLEYHESGNSLAIQKIKGNTKIIVPEDVSISLDIKVREGVVNVLKQRTKIDNVDFRYFSPDYESASKRVSLSVRVDSGNVEIIQG